MAEQQQQREMHGVPREQLRVGRTYRAKKPLKIGFDVAQNNAVIYNDRTILHLGARGVQWDGPAVKQGAHYPTHPFETWEQWCGGEVLTGENPSEVGRRQQALAELGGRQQALELTYQTWDPERHPQLAQWLIYAPGWAIWPCYLLSVIHLRRFHQDPGPAVLNYPEAAYEVHLAALNPERKPCRERYQSLERLTPLNYVGQFHGVDDRQAAGVARWLALCLTEGHLPPETSGITGAAKLWDSTVGRFVRAYQDGYLIREGDPLSILCLTCDGESHNGLDVERRYCGFCHVYHAERSPGSPGSKVRMVYGTPDPTFPSLAPNSVLPAARGAMLEDSPL